MKPTTIKLFFLCFLSLFFFGVCAQVRDTITSDSVRKDSLYHAQPNPSKKNHVLILDSLLKKNKYLNTSAVPVSFIAEQKNKTGKDFLFYVISIFILVLAIFKVFYARYFNNIFKVFFNTSLRQNQLTDLLLQAKLPSLIFNIFFILSAALYAWLVLQHYHLIKNGEDYSLIITCILLAAAIYFAKFFSLKFIGWIAGVSNAADQYIFVIFLINKITGIILIPFIILLAFAPDNWLNAIIIISFSILLLLFLLGYLRSFGLLQNQIKINSFHFLLYIIAVEFLPLLIIYKLINRLLI